MAAHRLLFLLGGPGAFEAAAEAFVPAAGGANAHIALLLAGGQGWEEHLPEYVQPWLARGAARYQVIVPREDGKLNHAAALDLLRRASGIFIGGGDTPTYRRLYAEDPVRALIHERYARGVPVAGMSAGALIAPEICAIPPEDTGDVAVMIRRGLGLVNGLIIGVHFSEWNALPHILEAMVKTGTPLAFGIDEGACAIFEDGRFTRALGRAVHEIRMTNFVSQDYRLTEHSQG